MILKISKQKKTIKDLGLIYTMRHAYLFVIHEKIPRAIVKHIKRERDIDFHVCNNVGRGHRNIYHKIMIFWVSMMMMMREATTSTKNI